MFKISTLAIAALFSLTGIAHASVINTAAFAKEYSGTNNSAAKANLTQPEKDGVTIDFRFIFTPTKTTGLSDDLEVNDFLGFWFNDATKGPNIGLKANCGNGTCTNDLFVRLGGSKGSFLTNSEIDAGKEYHLFGYLYKSKGSQVYDNFDAWLNPTAFQMHALTGAHASAVMPAVIPADYKTVKSIQTVGFRTDSLNNGVKVTVSNLNLNVDVVPVPEPSSLALLGLALVGLGAARRRKQA
ncbi:PEP-CTERM sorting domain-containing protein [Massilia niabensis]|uniref:PEP-CTERM sorting domain-containing protein n=1 Tax=Massilia niabensis TaxID=544910 RepID=A0ABW0L2E6_9BURK